MTTYMPGDYLHIPATQSHWGGAHGTTVIQRHGEGPFETLLAKPAASANNR